MSLIRSRLNAWADGGNADGVPTGGVSGILLDAAGWALRNAPESAPEFLAPRVTEPRNWRDPFVGWGVIVRDGTTLPSPIRELVAARAEVLKTKPEALIYSFLADAPGTVRYVCVRNHAARRDIAIEGAPSGVAADALPTYLLIVGTPVEVPWRLQYVLNTTRCVGRLALTDQALRNYVTALRGWDAQPASGPTSGAGARPERAVIWAVVHGDDDITRLMRDAIAAPLAAKLADDAQLKPTFIDGSAEAATGSALSDTLTAERPALIVTTSHGRTGPLDDPQKMADSLGMPITSDGTPLTPERLGSWMPDGAVWYAHACCSAGSDERSNFVGLFEKGSPAATVLQRVAALGSRVAPLPTALLGAHRPLRAFIGHVEPTFDWTLELPVTGQFLTNGLIDALYTRLYVAADANPPTPPSPIGYALRSWYRRTAGLAGQHRATELEFNRGKDVDEALLATALAVRDLESTVILGDPTVAIPPLH
jgi:hypothetical protein